MIRQPQPQRRLVHRLHVVHLHGHRRPHSTWTKIGVTWSGTPTQISGDVNANGTIELWGVNGSSATAYTLGCATTCKLTQESTSSLTPAVQDEWPLSDGSGPSAADTVKGNDATLNNTASNGATWKGGVAGSISPFGNHVTLDGNTGYLVLVGSTSSQTLYVDNQPGVQLNGTINSSGQGGNFSVGGGYIGYHWPSEPHYNQNGGTGYADYFTGQIADIIYG